MTPRHSILLVGLSTIALSLGACGSLELNVDIADPKIIEAERDRLRSRTLVPQLLTASDAEIEAIVDKIEAAHREAYADIASRLQAEINAIEDGNRKRRLQSQVLSVTEGFDATNNEQPSWAEVYAQAKPWLVAQKFELQRLNASVPEWRLPGHESARDAIITLAETIRRYVDSLGQDAARDCGETYRQLLTANSLGTSTLEAQAKVQRASTSALKSVIGDGSIVDSEYAFAVATAPETFWHRGFNHVYGGGTFGNLDVAIRMNELGDFMLKGLTFDPRDVAILAGKLATQAIMLGAQMAGMPVLTADTHLSANGKDVPGAALARSSRGLAATLAAYRARSSAVRQQRTALKSIALAILAERDQLASPQRSAALERIQSTYDVYKSKIVITAPSGNPNP